MESFMIRMEEIRLSFTFHPNNYNICINQEIVNNLTNFLGENNVKVVEKSIEKRA